MLPNFDHSEMPRALQRLLARDYAAEAATLPRRSFLKLAGAAGLALGAFPHLVTAQVNDSGKAASALKPTQQPSAFVQIAPNGEVAITINRLEFGQGVQTALPMVLAEELDADWNLVRSRNGSNDAARYARCMAASVRRHTHIAPRSAVVGDQPKSSVWSTRRISDFFAFGVVFGDPLWSPKALGRCVRLT